MGTKYLIDSNVLMDAQSKKLHINGLQFLAQAIDDDFTISFVSYIEFLGYRDVTSSMEEFVAIATVIETNKAIIETTIALRKRHRIKLPDAIIAATAIVYGRTLITRNIQDFNEIEGLNIINPWSL